MSASTPSITPGPGSAEALTALIDGELEIVGKLTDASNLTLLGRLNHDGLTMPCIYKPIRGERPLWDFPDSPLAHRERAAYLVAEAAGWHCVPPTVLRAGPYGEGMVQQWIGPPPDLPIGSDDSTGDPADDSADDPPDDWEQDPADDSVGVEPGDEPGDGPGDGPGDELVALLPAADVPDGWLPVFRAVDAGGTVLAVCHADHPALAVIAGFDAVVNNADRKAPHLLPSGDHVYGVDHGLTFHTDDKLRTILWGWAGRRLPPSVGDGLARLAQWLPDADELDELMSRQERRRLRQRIQMLADDGVFPDPPLDRTPIPWPPL